MVKGQMLPQVDSCCSTSISCLPYAFSWYEFRFWIW